MTLAGFNFTKILAERKPAAERNINVESNVTVTAVTELNAIDPKKMILKLEFMFTCKYEPGFGLIELHGELIELFEKEFGAKVMDLWKKEKKLHTDILSGVFNTILSRTNIEAIVISRELGLPSPIKMPKLDISSVPGKAAPAAPKKK